MGLTDIASIMEKYGFKGSIFVIFVFLIISMLKSSWFSGVLSKLSDSFVEKFMRSKVKDVNSHVKAIADSDITNHDIFNYIDFWTYSKVPTIQFSTEYRTAVFRKYLTIYLKSYKRKIFHVEMWKQIEAKLRLGHEEHEPNRPECNYVIAE
jgi:hypothetical protein